MFSVTPSKPDCEPDFENLPCERQNLVYKTASMGRKCHCGRSSALHEPLDLPPGTTHTIEGVSSSIAPRNVFDWQIGKFSHTTINNFNPKSFLLLSFSLPLQCC